MKSSPDSPRSRTLHDSEMDRDSRPHPVEPIERGRVQEDVEPSLMKQRVQEAVAALDRLIARARDLSKDDQSSKA